MLFPPRSLHASPTDFCEEKVKVMLWSLRGSEGDERGRVLTDLTTVIPCILSVYSLPNKQLSNINSQTLEHRARRLKEYC